MKLRMVAMALPVGLSLASCAHRQQTWGGPIISLQSVRLPQPVVEVTPATNTKWTGCFCRRHRRAGVARPRVAGSPARQLRFRYSHVLTDPFASSTSPSSLGSDAQDEAAVVPSPIGSWNVAGTLTACSVRLSSQGLLDVKRATVSGCRGSSVQNVNAWRSSGTSIELLEKGGHVPARFDSNGKGGFTSTSTDDGRSLQLIR
jgi:hypothetical protein